MGGPSWEMPRIVTISLRLLQFCYCHAHQNMQLYNHCICVTCPATVCIYTALICVLSKVVAYSENFAVLILLYALPVHEHNQIHMYT